MRQIFLALIAVGGSALASDQEWKQEPNAVMGIALGVPLSEEFPDCENGSRVDRSPARDLCVHGTWRATPGAALLGNLPFRDLHITGLVEFVEGRVAAIQLDLLHDDYEKFKRILTDRYGPAMNVGGSQVTANSGAAAHSELLSWHGTHARIIYVERSGRIDTSVVRFEDIELSRLQAESSRRDERAVASKL
jgi:hypothetical protein